MDRAYANQAVDMVPQMEGGLGLPANRIPRKRIIELQSLAVQAVEWADEHGLKRGEQCMFREMCERLWWAD